MIEKFLKEFSYKFPKGYPDFDDPNDIQILENILESALSNVDSTPINEDDEVPTPVDLGPLESRQTISEYLNKEYDKILNKIGTNDLIRFKNDPKFYYVKNLANDRLSLYVTDKAGQIFNKKIKNITDIKGKPFQVS